MNEPKAHAHEPRRRWLTANRVTALRILALPFPCWALLARPSDVVMWMAFFFGVVVGATDFVDGWMARRDGPTVLGALLDPVADKLFIALLLLPVTAHAECPGWAAGALFVRELLITSLRSSMSVRRQSLKTSQLGKLKTVVQMGGLGVFFLAVFVRPASTMAWTIFGVGVAFAVMAVGWWWFRRRLPLWLLSSPVLLWAVSAVAWVSPAETAQTAASGLVFVLMVLFTWVSGADYLWGSARAFRQTGGVGVADVARVLWSIAHGMALVPLLASGDDRAFALRLALPVIVSLSAELALGGVENLVAAERGRFARGSVIPTMLGAVLVGVCAWFELLPPESVLLMAWGLAALSVVNVVVAFVLDRDVFLSSAASPLPGQDRAATSASSALPG
jgi:CDP-diacylglycerol--glycerol-3-phosphate 3-phosphatidyltransferase